MCKVQSLFSSMSRIVLSQHQPFVPTHHPESTCKNKQQKYELLLCTHTGKILTIRLCFLYTNNLLKWNAELYIIYDNPIIMCTGWGGLMLDSV